MNLLHPDVSNTVTGKQQKQKEMHDKKRSVRQFVEGDLVYVENFSVSRRTRWIPGIVTKVTGPLSYQIRRGMSSVGAYCPGYVTLVRVADNT